MNVDTQVLADSISTVLLPSWDTVVGLVKLSILAALILSPLERRFPAQPQRFVRKEFFLDAIYWFTTPLLTRTVSGVVLLAVFLPIMLAFGIVDPAKLLDGRPPLSLQPLWLQIIEILLIADFLDYWTHRCLHSRKFWRIHAVHHTPEEMSWISSARVHPLNDLITRAGQVIPLTLSGFSSHAVLAIVPFISFYVMFLHSNLRWDFGILRYVFVSPAYHRWHHTSDLEGIDKNYAGLFPIWDLLFGTCYFPRRLPNKYGLAGQSIPESISAHLMYPFRKGRTKRTQAVKRSQNAVVASDEAHIGI